MSHSYYKIWIHAIYATKGREPLIHPDIEQQVYDHQKAELLLMDCPVRIINGMPDHVHLLFLQNPKLPITDIIKQVKGNTSHWLNEQQLIQERFAWQTGYAAYSVSESQLEKVYQYILHQKQHHSQNTFEDEYHKFVTLHG
jgi:REP element-mobilizing transposase RayT